MSKTKTSAAKNQIDALSALMNPGAAAALSKVNAAPKGRVNRIADKTGPASASDEEAFSPTPKAEKAPKAPRVKKEAIKVEVASLSEEVMGKIKFDFSAGTAAYVASRRLASRSATAAGSLASFLQGAIIRPERQAAVISFVNALHAAELLEVDASVELGTSELNAALAKVSSALYQWAVTHAGGHEEIVEANRVNSSAPKAWLESLASPAVGQVVKAKAVSAKKAPAAAKKTSKASSKDLSF